MTIKAGKTGTSRGVSTYNSLDVKQLRELIAKEQKAALSVLPNETICEQRKKDKRYILQDLGSMKSLTRFTIRQP